MLVLDVLSNCTKFVYWRYLFNLVGLNFNSFFYEHYPLFSYLVFYMFQAHAASAVLNFSENCTPDILTPYLDGIVSKLLVLLQVYNVIHIYFIEYVYICCSIVCLWKNDYWWNSHNSMETCSELYFRLGMFRFRV